MGYISLSPPLVCNQDGRIFDWVWPLSGKLNGYSFYLHWRVNEPSECDTEQKLLNHFFQQTHVQHGQTYGVEVTPKYKENPVCLPLKSQRDLFTNIYGRVSETLFTSSITITRISRRGILSMVFANWFLQGPLYDLSSFEFRRDR
jgi:hypothetical protein